MHYKGGGGNNTRKGHCKERAMQGKDNARKGQCKEGKCKERTIQGKEIQGKNLFI